jgi:hypothetical protein
MLLLRARGPFAGLAGQTTGIGNRMKSIGSAVFAVSIFAESVTLGPAPSQGA